jgi:LCP family protein required for cell wall assembly
MHDEIIIRQDELDGIRPGNSSGQPPQMPDNPNQEPSRSRPWKRWLKWIAIVIGLAVIAAIIFVVANLFKVSVNPFSFGHLKGESQGRVNIMMLGVGDPGHAGEQLSDTNIILSVDTRNHQVAIIGIPRDLRVTIPNYGKAKINNANAQGGIKTAKKVYEDTFGVPIHYYVKANFTGLKEVVDAVGGVDVTNDTLLYDPEYPCDKNEGRKCGFRLAAGTHHLDGATALKYVRCRKGTCGDDFGRAARQQEVMQSVRQHATSAGTLTNPVALTKLVSAAGDNIDTDLSVSNLARLNELTKDADKSKVMNVVFSLNPDGFLKSAGSDLVPSSGDFDDIQAFVQNIFKVGPIWSEHPTVMIENGTTTPGVATKFQQQLKDDGYNVSVVAVTNALRRDYATSQLVDYTAGKRPNTLKYLQGLLKVQQPSQPQTAVKTPPADIVIILGDDYASTIQNDSSGSTSGTRTNSSTR